MTVVQILKIVALVFFDMVFSTIPFIIALYKALKARKVAKSEAEAQAANNDLLNIVNMFIANAEETYKNVDNILKQSGSSAGAVKKDTVMTKLQAYALDKGYEFDIAYWSNKVDEIVTLTKQVNAK